MHYEIDVNGKVHTVTVSRRGGQFVVALGERHWVVDATAIGGHTLSLLIERNGRAAAPGTGLVSSREVAIAIDPATSQLTLGIGSAPLSAGLNTRRRWGRKDDAAQGGSGPQRLVAPMPGKVIRLLAKVGDAVAHRQPVVVIEAMKMENELRAARDGSVSQILVNEGQSVEAGALLAIITPP